MKESKAVYVTKRDIRENLHRDHQWYTNNNIVNTIEVNKYKLTNDVGIQYNSKRDNIFYAHRNFSNVKRYYDHDLRYFNPIPKQIFTYSRSKSFTDIGVGSVKALQKKKVKKIYLPETDDRGVGSSDLTSFITRMQSVQNKNKAAKQYRAVQSYYESKKTSSKCVGGGMECRPEHLVSAKVSPIVHTQSGSTSPKDPGLRENCKESKESKDIETGTIINEKQFVTTDTQFEEPEEEAPLEETANEKVEERRPNIGLEIIDNMIKTLKHSTEEVIASVEVAPSETKPSLPKLVVVLPENRSERPEPLKGSFSSDSLVQHVHNLEQPSEYSKQRDPMENKMEREYRKMFASISRDEKTEGAPEKQQIPQKSTSLFRRRFTAIRKSLGKKESKNAVPKDASVPSVKDASVTSDPPSLEERSFSSINGYPTTKKKTNRKASYKRSYTGKQNSKTWSKPNPIDSEYSQGVKGMFKLWGKKFNLDDTSDAKDDLTQPSSFDEKPKPEDEPKEKEETPKTITEPVPEIGDDEKIYDKGKEKKEGKKFLFFKKKQSKDKAKNPNTTYKNKKGVTTGRCEVKDGLSLRMGAARAPSPAKSKTPPPPLVQKEISTPIEHYDDLVRTAWLMKYLSNPIESRNSVKVRWNNKTYTTSSSTVFELMGNVYKSTGVVLKSKSEITTDASSTWSYNRPNVNFVQNIEAWMIPTTVLDQKLSFMPKNKSENMVSRKISKSDSKNIEVTISDQKWIIDKSEAFAHKIEIVLHSKNLVKLHNPETNTECIRIDIPKGFFSDTSSDDPQPEHTSDEEVYNIVEYESGNCGPAVKHAETRSKSRDLNSGDHSESQNIQVKVSVRSGMYEEANIMETVIKRPPVHRDVIIQGSNVYIPKMCDVIGVGIITQRDVQDVGKSILRVMEYLPEEESDHSLSKPCPSNKAKSYLEEYYRHWEHIGMDMFSLCYSDSHIKCTEQNSRGSFNNGDATAKSCPNIFEDYVAIMSSGSSQCCHEAMPGRLCHDDKKNKKKSKKEKKKNNEISPYRVLPKDSLEVFKKRKIYAKEKSKWTEESSIGPYSCPSNTDTGVPGQNVTSSKGKKVGLPDLPDKPSREYSDTGSDKKPPGIIRYANKKNAKISPNIGCTIPDSDSCCRDDPCASCSPHSPPGTSAAPCSSPSPCPAYGDCPSEMLAPCIKYGSPKPDIIGPLSSPTTCLPCPKSPPCPESSPCPPSPAKSPPCPKPPSPVKSLPRPNLPTPTKSLPSPKPPTRAKSQTYSMRQSQPKSPCSKPLSPDKSPPYPKPPTPAKSPTLPKLPSPVKSPPAPNPQSTSKSLRAKSGDLSSRPKLPLKGQTMPRPPPETQPPLDCTPCPLCLQYPPSPPRARHHLSQLPSPSKSPASYVGTDPGSLENSSPTRRPKLPSKRSPQCQRQSGSPFSESCSPSQNEKYEQKPYPKSFTSVSSCSMNQTYVEPPRPLLFQSYQLPGKSSLSQLLSILNCSASLHKSVQCRGPLKCGGFETPPPCPSQYSRSHETQIPSTTCLPCPPAPPCPRPCRPRCPTGIKLSNTECIKLPKPIRYGPPPCPSCCYPTPCPPPPCPPKTPPCPTKTPPCPTKTPPCPPPPCPTKTPPCPPPPSPPKIPPCPPPPCPPKTPPCPPPPCTPKILRCPPCPPKTLPCPPKTPPCVPPPCPPKTPPCPPKTPPCPPKTPPCPPKTPPCPPKTPPCPPETPPSPRETPPFRPKTPPLCSPKSSCDAITPPSPRRSPGCSLEASSCSSDTPPPCPPRSPPCQSKASSCSPKPSPCPSPPRCPHGVKISNTDCIKLPKPKRYGSPCPSCECHTPPRSPPCPSKDKPCPPKPCPPKTKPHKPIPCHTKTEPCPPKSKSPKNTKHGSPDTCEHGIKLTNCDKYGCPAAPKPRPADCCKEKPCPLKSRGKTPSRSRDESPCLMHINTPPSPFRSQPEISQVKCSCSTPQLSDQMIKGDTPSIESVHRSHKSSCTPSTFLASVSSQYENQDNDCDENESDVYEDQGDYCAEECPNIVTKSQSEPKQYPVDDVDTELMHNHPKSQPNMQERYNCKMTGINLKKFPRKISNYTIPTLVRLNSKENIMFKYDHDNVSIHEMKDGYVKIHDDDNVTLIERKDYENTKQACINHIYSDQQGNRITAPITINEIASVERDKKITESKSTDSVVNMIEINFKLRVIQGDKTTEINIANDDSKITTDEKSEKSNNTNNKHLDDAAKEVYILKDGDADEEVNPKNDLNIRIIIKNYKPKEPSKEKKAVDDFAQKISKKFNTVSTGYSVDFRGEHPDDTCFSVHRATIDLTTSERSITSKNKLLFKKSEVRFKDEVKSDEILSRTLGSKPEVISSGQAISVTEVESISEIDPINSTTLPTLSDETKSLSFGLSKPKSNQSLSAHSAVVESKQQSSKRIDHKSSKTLRFKSSRSIPKKWSKSDEDYSVRDKKYHNPELVTLKVSKSSVKVKDIFKSQARLSFTDTDEHDFSLENKTSEEPTSRSLNVKTSEDHTDPTDYSKSSDPDSDTKTSEVLIEKVPTQEIEYLDLGKSKKEEKKEMLKAVFDTANYFKKPKTKNRIQKLKDMLKALLTSDDTDSDTDNDYKKLAIVRPKCAWDPKVKHHSDSLNNFFEGGSLIVSRSLTKSHIENYSSLQSNRSAYSEDEEKSENKTCICSNFAEKLNLGNSMGGGCCCRRQLPEKVSEQISCNFINELTLEDYSYFAPSVECVHCQTNNSRYKSSMHCAKIISISSKKSSLVPHSQKTSSITPHTQEETYDLYNLDIEPFSSQISNRSYKRDKEFKDSSSREGDFLQEDTDNLETEPVCDKISIKSYERDSKLKEDSYCEGYFAQEANKKHEEEPISSRVSIKSHKREKELNKKSSHENNFQEIDDQKYSGTKCLRITDEDKVHLENNVTITGLPGINKKKKKHYTKVRNQADVLQMYETKKAVLEIYAEKTVTDGGEHLVAKLPKYVRDRKPTVRELRTVGTEQLQERV